MPTWSPSLSDVGGCIPTRTVNVNLPGSEDYLNTFTTDTRPTALQVQEKIDQATNDVLSAVAAVGPDLEDVAKNAAMWRAAADAELSYPERNADANYYAALDARAKYEWSLLIAASEDQGTGTSGTIPQWYMPDPTWYGDRTDI